MHVFYGKENCLNFPKYYSMNFMSNLDCVYSRDLTLSVKQVA